MRSGRLEVRTGTNRPVEETLATELLVEYEERILSGDWPDLDEFMERYKGAEPGNFRLELELAAVLLAAGRAETRRPTDDGAGLFGETV